MLQRKQTLFLAIAALLAFSSWFFPVTTYDRGGQGFVLRTTGLYTAEGVEVTDVSLKVPFAVLFTVVGVALVACIFLYGNRPRQMRFVRGTYLATLGLFAFIFITGNSVESYLGTDATMESSYGFSFIIPILMLVLAFMAERAIRADEALVRSADRLR